MLKENWMLNDSYEVGAAHWSNTIILRNCTFHNIYEILYEIYILTIVLRSQRKILDESRKKISLTVLKLTILLTQSESQFCYCCPQSYQFCVCNTCGGQGFTYVNFLNWVFCKFDHVKGWACFIFGLYLMVALRFLYRNYFCGFADRRSFYYKASEMCFFRRNIFGPVQLATQCYCKCSCRPELDVEKFILICLCKETSKFLVTNTFLLPAEDYFFVRGKFQLERNRIESTRFLKKSSNWKKV